MVYKALKTSDGAGVSINRSIGTQQLSVVDPFLLLDEFSSDDPDDYIAGFPSHPHRGFETVTYMIDGKLQHEDSAGNRGELQSGSVQWMTAGKGVVHSEMPLQENGLMRGFQLWLNLPAKHKMMEPRYQNLEPSDIPEIMEEDYKVKVIAGEFQGIKGPVNGVITDPVYLDVTINPETEMQIAMPDNHNAVAYIFEGAVDLGEGLIDRGNLIVLSNEGDLYAKSGKDGARFLVLAATALNEPIARSGPFVMNTREEIMKAYEDFRF